MDMCALIWLVSTSVRQCKPASKVMKLPTSSMRLLRNCYVHKPEFNHSGWVVLHMHVALCPPGQDLHCVHSIQKYTPLVVNASSRLPGHVMLCMLSLPSQQSSGVLLYRMSVMVYRRGAGR